MKNKTEINPARQELIELSKIAKKAIAAGLFESVNEFLVDHYAKVKGCGTDDFKTFSAWGEDGLKIKKGAKAVWVWAAPRKGKNKVEAENVATGEKETIEDSYKFWPVAKLFAKSDTEEMSEKFKEFIANKKGKKSTR